MEKIATVRGSDSGGRYSAKSAGHSFTLPASTARPNTMVSVEKMPMKILRKLDIPVALKVVKAHNSAAAPRTAVVASSPLAATASAMMPNNPRPMLKSFIGMIRGCRRHGALRGRLKDHRPQPESTGVRSQHNVG